MHKIGFQVFRYKRQTWGFYIYPISAAMWVFGKATTRVGENFLMLGTGIALIATNGKGAFDSLFNLMGVIKDLKAIKFGEDIAGQINLIADA